MVGGVLLVGACERHEVEVEFVDQGRSFSSAEKRAVQQIADVVRAAQVR
jgi:hypothetical protein